MQNFEDSKLQGFAQLVKFFHGRETGASTGKFGANYWSYIAILCYKKDKMRIFHKSSELCLCTFQDAKSLMNSNVELFQQNWNLI